MNKWLQMGLHMSAILLISHLFGYLLPTVHTTYYIIFKLIRVISVFIAVTIFLLLSYKPKPITVQTYSQQTNIGIINKTKKKLAELRATHSKIKGTPLVSRDVDDLIYELITLLLENYVTPWYSALVTDPSTFNKDLRVVIRQMLVKFRDRCVEIDEVELFANDFVLILKEHFQNIRAAVINPSEKIQPYKVSKFLIDQKSELSHLRLLSEFLLTTILPQKYVRNKLLRCLLREIFAVKIFYPTIDKFCDPDFINVKLINFITLQHMKAEKHRKNYEFAETYEDFIELVRVCNDLESLKRMRYYIATETMEATTASFLKRSKGIDADKEFITQKTNKGDLLEARNLSRYLNQLRFSRSEVEKRLKVIGGADYVSSSKLATDNFNKNVYIPGQKVLSMAVIMQSKESRKYFSKFLQKNDVHSLLGFWEGVEEMKYSDKEMWHKLGNDIVKIYVHNSSSSVRLTKNTLKGIEEFMMANKGPEAFFRAQVEVYKSLEFNYYGSFIVSDVYHRMLAEMAKKGVNFMQETIDEEGQEVEASAEDDIEEVVIPETSEVSLFDHSSYARSQLKTLVEKLADKKQALDALKSNPKCEKKVIAMLDTEIENLVQERNMLENHIEKTELWIEYLGRWQATIMDAMEKKENEKLVPYFVIRVHLANDAVVLSNQMSGWVVSKNLNSFHSLHQKLVPAASWLKKIVLPTKPRIRRFERNYLGRAKNALQTFISAVTKDDGLNKSEALYDFLSPSPDHMKHPAVPPKKLFKFNILNFLKVLQNTVIPFDRDNVDEELFFLDDSDGKEDKKDSIAEPLYLLIDEIFELKGVFGWLRRSLILFVQVTYGQTINRQLRETVSWILSEPMLLFYFQLFRDTMWPPAEAAPPVAEGDRTQDIKSRDKVKAKVMFIKNTPVILSNLLGLQNSKKGLSKVFDALQNKNFNKNLFYKLFEAFLYKYAPELKRITSLYSIEENQTTAST